MSDLKIKSGTPFKGISKAAIRRRAERNRGKLHTGRAGDLIEMSRDRRYYVAPDGSFRRMDRAAA